MNRSQTNQSAQAILDFWFLDSATGRHDIPQSKRWFNGGPSVDEQLKSGFAGLLLQAHRGELDHWQNQADTNLALIVLLDQFNRNINRGTADAFAGDARALAACQHALNNDFAAQLPTTQRVFCYMPLEHDESDESQALSIKLFEELLADAPTELTEFAEGTLKYAIEHKDIIDRFGRYPHRNAVLGRTSTAEEERWLAESNKRFGQ